MALYRYIAREDRTGALRRGELRADTGYQVRGALRRMALRPVKVERIGGEEPRPNTGMGEGPGPGPEPVPGAGVGVVPGAGVERPTEAPAAQQTTANPRRAPGFATRFRGAIERFLQRRRRGELVDFYESLATLTASGTPLVAALEAAASSGRTATRARLLADRVRDGSSLADAMDEPALRAGFGPVDTALVRAAEESGDLDRALADLAETHARASATSNKLAAALAYPALLAVFGTGVTVFLATTTLPPLAAVLRDAGVDLPLSTSLLLAFGDGLASLWPVALISVGAAGFGVRWVASSDRTAVWRLRLPLIGPAVLKGSLGEAASLLARLLDSGIPLDRALELTEPGISNAAVRADLARVRAGLVSGQGLTEQSETPSLDPVFERVLALGEQSGELPVLLRRVGERYRVAAARQADRIAAALEPTMILALAAMIGTVAYGAIVPMLRLSQSLQ